ncbi:MAG TPA: CotS family spore coat protein [Clostridiaceae bacterium]|nr:CotS family spore coat protein [Clostridiaceae bacterium]
MHDINYEIADQFDFQIKAIVPYKDFYIVNTSKGKKALKKCTLSPGRILFVHGAKEHLYNNNFRNIDRFICTADGRPYIYIGDEIYTVTDFIEGRECDFNNRDDIVRASRLLASLHKASRGYKPPYGCIIQDDLGKLPFYFEKRLGELRRLKKVAGKRKSEFDYLYINHVDHFIREGEDAIKLLHQSNYNALVDKARKEGIFCHHDFSYHNIICDENKAFVTNFNYCCFELKLYDIANLLRRKMRKCNWDLKEAGIMIDEYMSVENISKDEFLILRIMLKFPQKFWRLANRYYNSRRSWAERIYTLKLQEVIDEIDYLEPFLRKFEYLF